MSSDPHLFMQAIDATDTYSNYRHEQKELLVDALSQEAKTSICPCVSSPMVFGITYPGNPVYNVSFVCVSMKSVSSGA